MDGRAAPALTKWYIDCVDEAGRAAIVYWSAVTLGRFRLSVNNLALVEPGARAQCWGSFSRTPEPVVSAGRLSWRASTVGCSLDGEVLGRPFERRLLDAEGLTVDWRCVACPMRLDVTLPDGRGLSGLGYAERLVVVGAPWRLPIEELRWGRWIARTGDHSVVWIDWRGTHPLTEVFVDGEQSRPAAVGDHRIAAGDAALSLSDGRALLHRSVGDVVGSLGPLRRLVPAAWLDVRDSKHVSQGTFDAAGTPRETGWAISEYVKFP